MKVFIAILALFTVSISSEYAVKSREDLINFRQECQSELKIPAEKIEQYKKWNFPDDETTHCYMKCVFQKLGLFDDTNGYNVHHVHQQLVGGSHADHSDDVHAKIEKCADKNDEKSDTCLWAYRGAMCFIKENLRFVKDSVKTKA